MNVRILTMLLGLVVACGDKATRPEVTATRAERGRAERVAGRVAGGVAASAAPPAVAQTAGQAPSVPASAYWTNQKLIRTAEVRIQVRDVPAAFRQIDSLAQSAGALVADSRTAQDDDGRRTADVVLRVPSQQFPALLRTLRGVGSVKSESIGTEDVTKEYADLETRLAVQEQTVTRLRALLDNRTAKLGDVLEVER